MLKIYKYNEIFSKLFNKELKKLTGILGNNCIIEHIGSTAIKEVDGKGVIDIMIAFNDQNEIKKAINSLQKNSYYLIADGKDRKERTLMTSIEPGKESDFGDIHLHLTKKTDSSFLDAILFRDFLRKTPKERQQYTELKYKLLEETFGDRKKYTELKNDFIKKIIIKAKKN